MGDCWLIFFEKDWLYFHRTGQDGAFSKIVSELGRPVIKVLKRGPVEIPGNMAVQILAMGQP
jgi:hypothetical protein